jgi:methylglutaconyl-CoA hydratase
VQKIGPSAARELFLTASRFNAKRARRMGLIHRIVPESDLDSAVDEYVQEILSSAPGAIAAAKALIKDVANRPSADVIGLTTTRIAEQRVSAEGQEGMRAFLQKRKPNWIP